MESGAKMTIDGRECLLFGSGGDLIIQPVDKNEYDTVGSEYGLIRELSGGKDFTLCAFPVDDWNGDLSPWEAPPVFGKSRFAGNADKTLEFVERRLIPALSPREARVFIGGYSLAGLFALWAAHRSGAFEGAAACSPSVWFPGWKEYSLANAIKAKRVYLSIGDREELTKNRIMASVGDNLREQYRAASQNAECVLVYNPGGHFADAGRRTAAGMAWLLK